MAQPATAIKLRDALVRYLQICEGLGQREVVLKQETVQALEALRDGSASSAVREELSSYPAPVEPKASDIPVDSGEKNFRKPAVADTYHNPVEIPAAPKLDGLDKKDALEAIRNEVLNNEELKACFKNAQNMVFGVGDPNADIMFIGEAPGADEDIQGEPFVGAAGKLLDKMIAAMAIQRESVYIANVVKYRPDMPQGSRGNRKPTPDELASCRPYIMQQIRVIQPKVIVGLGATAMEGLLGKSKVSITRLRGQWEDIDGIPLMPTFHPAYLLHNDSVSEKRKVWEDLLQVMRKVELPVSPKQERYFKGKA